MVDADIVDLQLLRPDISGNALSATPTAADGEIKQQVEGAIEGPLAVIGVGVGEAFIGKSEMVFAVDREADFPGRPSGGVDVECGAGVS